MKRLSAIERFEAKINKTDTCWLWKAGVSSSGYGLFSVGSKTVGTRTMQGAHVFAYETYVGPIDDGLCVLHSCDVKLCVRPTHLFLGTLQDNVADMMSKHRNQRGSRNGRAKLTENDVLQIRNLLNKMRGKDVAALFGVSVQTISGIKTGRRWALNLPA